jgi:hypothetical protein
MIGERQDESVAAPWTSALAALWAVTLARIYRVMGGNARPNPPLVDATRARQPPSVRPAPKRGSAAHQSRPACFRRFAVATTPPTSYPWESVCGTYTKSLSWSIATLGTDSYDVADITVPFTYLTPQS